MATGPYVHERRLEYWTSRQIEDYFQQAGFELLVFPLTQGTERDLPADFVFFDPLRSKLIGLQYKALYHNGRDHWILRSHQHGMLSQFGWVHYAASDLRDSQGYRNSLHHTRFFSGTFPFVQRLVLGREPRYLRWGAFVDAFNTCTVGKRVRDRQHLVSLLWPYLDRDAPDEIAVAMPDVFLADLESRRLIHLVPPALATQPKPDEL